MYHKFNKSFSAQCSTPTHLVPFGGAVWIQAEITQLIPTRLFNTIIKATSAWFDLDEPKFRLKHKFMCLNEIVIVSAFFSWFASCNWWRVWFLVPPFPPCGPPLLGCFDCLDFCPCPLFPFLSLSWVLSFYKVWQGFINWKRCWRLDLPHNYSSEWIVEVEVVTMVCSTRWKDGVRASPALHSLWPCKFFSHTQV